MRSRFALAALCFVVSGSPADLGVEGHSDTLWTTNYLFRGVDAAPFCLVRRSEAWYRVSNRYRVTAASTSHYQLSNVIRSLETRMSIAVTATPPGPAEFTLGWERFSRSSSFGPDTGELFARVDSDLPWSPSVSWHYDHQGRVGSYLRVAVADEQSLAPGLALTTRVGVGLDVGRGVDTYRDAELELGLLYRPAPGWWVGPEVALVAPSHEVATYGARLVGSFGFGYSTQF